jgi:hypothetical protein
VAVLHLLGLFDQPADEKAIEVLINGPVIPGLTEFQLDTHPIVREHFGEQLRTDQSLTEENQLFVLTQAGMCLTATRGHSAPEAPLS